jgi:hypothetical protein
VDVGTDIIRASAADIPTKSAKELAEKKMSPQRRNELLAKGLCFICEEAGHLARNCPKTSTVTSKQKGKPPGFGTHAVRLPTASDSSRGGSALYESTEVLETLPLGAMDFALEVEEAGEPIQEQTAIANFNFNFHRETKNLLDDILVNYAAWVLRAGQPYPGDDSSIGDESLGNESRFTCTRFQTLNIVLWITNLACATDSLLNPIFLTILISCCRCGTLISARWPSGWILMTYLRRNDTPPRWTTLWRVVSG